jgi:hypothetical protein
MQDSLDSVITKISAKFQVNTAVAVHITEVWDVATLNFKRTLPTFRKDTLLSCSWYSTPTQRHI